jgi:PAS domain S-box-containing protein
VVDQLSAGDGDLAVRLRELDWTGARVQELIKRHDAGAADAALSDGSQFLITIPLARPSANAQSEPPQPASAGRSESFVREVVRWLAQPQTNPDVAQMWMRADRASGETRLDGDHPGPPARIVWADDNPELREYVARLLGQRFDVEAMPDGRAALTAIRANPPDLILSVVTMPGLDGFALLRELRAQATSSSVPLVLLSARGAADTPAIEAAARDYETRPFSARVLLARLGAHLEIARLRRASDEAIRRGEARKAAMFEAALDCIITIDCQGRVVEFNAAAERTFGYRRQEVLGREMAEVIIPPSLRERHRQGLARYLATGESSILNRRIELVALRADGSEFPVELAVTRIPTDGPPAFTGYLRDITERKTAEQRLRTQYTISRILAESATLAAAASNILRAICELLGWHFGALWYLDRHDKLLRCSDACSLPGVRVPQFAALSRELTFASGIGLPGRVLATGRAAWIRDVTRDANFPRAPVAAAEGLHGAFGFPILLAGEVLGVIEFFSHEIRQPDHDLLEMMTAVGSQIGQFIDRKRAEDALRESEERFARFMQHLPGLAWIKDVEGRYVFANDAAQKAFQTPREKLYGKTDQQLFSPQIARQFRENDRRALSVPAGVQVVETLEHADGVVHHSLVSKFPIPGGAGQPTLVGGMAIDITDRKQAEEELRRANAGLQEADRRKTEFRATLAHELRNPLAPIRTGLELLHMAKDDPQLMNEVRGTMERQLKQMVRLIDDLLDVSRITSGKLELRRCKVELAQIVQTAVEAARPFIDERGHELSITLPGQRIFLDADPQRVSQVLSNLLNNAAKYTPEGGRIALAAQAQGTSIRIAVRDSGIGIPSDRLDYIFQMFAQVDQSLERGYTGLGIGLTLAKSLVEMHGGRIDVQSAGPNQGSEFGVRLPIFVAALPQPQGLAPGVSVARPARRLLVVDDNKDAANGLALVLRMLGHEVVTAYDGLEALDVAARFLPDAVLLDLGMPKLNGYDTARRIREAAWGARTVLVALTGWGQEEDKERSRQAGFDHHLTKPAEPAALQAILETGPDGNPAAP